MMTSAFLSTLSLSAEKNCAQNSGAKRRDDIKSLIRTSPVLATRFEVVSLSDGRRDRRNATGICGLTTIAPACSAPLPSDPVGLRVATFGSQMVGRGSVTLRQGWRARLR